MKKKTCPRCAGWLEPAQLEGKDRLAWIVIHTNRCVNCGWYGSLNHTGRSLPLFTEREPVFS